MNMTLPPQSKRQHRRHCGRRRRRNSRSRPCLFPPPPSSLLIIYNSVVAPNFDGHCMSLRNFDILFSVTQGDGYAAANWRRLILSRICSIYLQQRQKRSRCCQEIDIVVSLSFRQKPFYDNPPVLRGISTGVLIKSAVLNNFDVHCFCRGRTLHECTTIDTI